MCSAVLLLLPVKVPQHASSFSIRESRCRLPDRIGVILYGHSAAGVRVVLSVVYLPNVNAYSSEGADTAVTYVRAHLTYIRRGYMHVTSGLSSLGFVIQSDHDAGTVVQLLFRHRRSLVTFFASGLRWPSPMIHRYNTSITLRLVSTLGECFWFEFVVSTAVPQSWRRK